MVSYGFVVVLPPRDIDNEYILPLHAHWSINRSDITADGTLCALNPPQIVPTGSSPLYLIYYLRMNELHLLLRVS